MSSVPQLALDPAVQIALRAGLSLLFLWSAAHKLRDLAAFRAAVSAYRLLPESLSGIAAPALIGAELLVGSGLICVSSVVPVLAGAALLSLYFAAIAINLVRGRRIDCGCTGPAARQPLSPALLMRNGLLLAAALVTALPRSSRQLVWIDVLTVAGCVGVMSLLYVSFDTLLANAPQLRELRRHDDPLLSPLPPGEAG